MVKLTIKQLAKRIILIEKQQMRTLEEDLIHCFKKRKIEIKELIVSNSAKTYTIQVKR